MNKTTYRILFWAHNLAQKVLRYSRFERDSWESGIKVDYRKGQLYVPDLDIAGVHGTGNRYSRRRV